MIDWTSQNVVPYLQDLMSRIVSYEISIYVFWMIFCPIIATVLGIVGYKFITKAQAMEDNYVDWCETFRGVAGITSAVIAIGFTVATLVIIPVGTIRIIECVNIPEKIVIELLTNLS